MNPSLPPLGPNEYVTWIKVEPDTFDLLGVIVSSLGFTVMCVSIAIFLGSFVGVGLIMRRRKSDEEAASSVLFEA